MTHVDTMASRMTKQKENIDWVWYKFELNVEVGTYLSKSGNLRYKFEPRYGLFKFKKTGEITNDSFEFIKDETEPIFLQDKKIKERISYACLSKMFQCKRENIFPDKVSFQSG